MPRSMTPAMETAIAANLILPALFVEGTFATGPIYIWTGNYSITWGGHTWLGLGTLGAINPIEEGSTVEAKGITLVLSGFDPALLADVLGEFQLGAPVAVYLGFFDPGTLVLLSDPIPAWAGQMSQPVIEVEGKSGTITIQAENRLVEMNVAVDRRLTNQDQQLVSRGDLGLSFISGIAETTIYWGATPNSANNQ